MKAKVEKEKLLLLISDEDKWLDQREKLAFFKAKLFSVRNAAFLAPVSRIILLLSFYVDSRIFFIEKKYIKKSLETLNSRSLRTRFTWLPPLATAYINSQLGVRKREKN